jgi:hypothetical protein
MNLYVRTARNIAITALVLDGLAISAILAPAPGMTGLLSGFVLAALGSITSIAGIVMSARCVSPRPVGSAGALLLSLAIIGWLLYATHQLAGLANMH